MSTKKNDDYEVAVMSTFGILNAMVLSLVDKPKEVKVGVTIGDAVTMYEITVAQSDMGKVIGKEGKIINALRTIVYASSMRECGRKATVELVDGQRKDK